jgi:hypothetical protein
MVAYELYLHNEKKEHKLFGILPERRKDPKRITKESVLKWGRMVLGDGAKEDIIIKQMSIDDATGQMFEVNMGGQPISLRSECNQSKESSYRMKLNQINR